MSVPSLEGLRRLADGNADSKLQVPLTLLPVKTTRLFFPSTDCLLRLLSDIGFLRPN